MTAPVLSIVPERNTDNVIQLSLVNGKLSKKEKIKYNKDGSIDKRHSNRVTGVSSEVYAFTSDEEIKAMIDVFDRHINETTSDSKKQIACRNKMLFLIGINVGLRASDIVRLTWDFILNDDGSFKYMNKLQPKKTRKQGKYVKVYFNNNIRKAITEYISEYPITDMSDYIFKSRQGNKPITEAMLWKVIKDTAAEAGIKQNIGSHSLRKTFGYRTYHNAVDKSEALVRLQVVFNHSSPKVTAAYIGVSDDDIADLYYSLDYGLDYD